MQYTDLPFRTLIVPFQANVPNIRLNDSLQQWITVHTTGNTRTGANAKMHADFVRLGGGDDNVSFHFCVDDDEAIQILNCGYIGYHASDGCNDRVSDIGCYQSLAIETCVNADGIWSHTKDNLSKLITMIVEGDERIIGLRQDSYDYARIATHQKWAWDSKYCPAPILTEGSLPTIIATAEGYGAPPPTPNYAKPRADLQVMLGDSNHVSVNNARIYRFRDKVKFDKPTTPRQYADLTAPPIGPDKTEIDVIAYIAQSNGFKWFLGKDNGRYLMTDNRLTVL
jgi:N-acetylmuramoyl-L-alanine amidase CwlA